jgi:hypothetical protein
MHVDDKQLINVVSTWWPTSKDDMHAWHAATRMRGKNYCARPQKHTRPAASCTLCGAAPHPHACIAHARGFLSVPDEHARMGNTSDAGTWYCRDACLCAQHAPTERADTHSARHVSRRSGRRAGFLTATRRILDRRRHARAGRGQKKRLRRKFVFSWWGGEGDLPVWFDHHDTHHLFLFSCCHYYTPGGVVGEI